MITGAHMSKTKGFAHAAKQAHDELNANGLQVFLKSPRGGASKPLDPADLKKYKEVTKELNVTFIIGHASYLLNLAKPLTKDRYQLESLREDLEKLGQLGGSGLVYHIGKYLDLDYEDAFEILIQNLEDLLDLIKPYGVPLLLENGSGQGTEMGTRFEEIGRIRKELNDPDLIKVCIDTCHAFAAGYDLSHAEGVTQFFKELEEHIGLKNIICFHLNDSKFGLGENKDRHENLNKGKIGAGLKHVALTAKKHNIPLILETPLVNNSHKIDMEILHSWLK